MKAIVYEGINKVAVKQAKDPVIEKSDDIIFKVTLKP